jgi:hypothetical protein
MLCLRVSWAGWCSENTNGLGGTSGTALLQQGKKKVKNNTHDKEGMMMMMTTIDDICNTDTIDDDIGHGTG